MNIEIITPAIDNGALNQTLRGLTREIYRIDPKKADECGGVLGGFDGYGANIETPAFVMRVFRYDDDCTCEQDEPGGGCRRECGIRLNFEHKASGFAVRWYKYIGRGFECYGTAPDLSAMLAECVASLAVA